MQNPQTTANIIKLLAKSKKISISKLLSDCELNKNALYTMQSGGYYPRVESLVKIADYLDCSVDFLLGRQSGIVNSPSITGDKNVIQQGSIRNSPIHIGDNSSMSELESELLKVFENLTLKQKTKLMTFAYELEEEEN